VNYEDKTVEVFSGTLWESDMIKSLLDDAGIESFLKNSLLNTYAFNAAFAQEVGVMIMESDLEGAKRIVENYLLNK
jgi:hypothetical protein